MTPLIRLRRLRQGPLIRDLVTETRLVCADLIMPLFVRSGHKIKNPIHSMPGCYQLSLDQLPAELDALTALGIKAVILFGIPEYKDEQGSDALEERGIIATAIRAIKQYTQELLVISDLCFCEYTSHGHCGVLRTTARGHQEVDNEATVKLLARQAVVHAKAGADVIAPSGMMDGMVASIRAALDKAGFHERLILSYAVKFASNFYGPFRDATEGAPQFGDRATYQMNPANANEALYEAALDVQEGADMLMVKPGLSYLDIIYRVKQKFPQLPLGAYQVSGEYAMIKAAAEKGWLDETKVMLESLLSLKRAGADFIVTYFAKEAAMWLRSCKE